MIGAVIGDIAGSFYEFTENKDADVDLFPPDCGFTDDSILTVATASAILNRQPYRDAYLEFGRRFPCPLGGYGIRFGAWLRQQDPEPYNSWGNGSAMRVGPVGWAFDTMETVLAEAGRSAKVSHNHAEGIKGAQATAAAVWMAARGKSKEAIRSFISENFGYDLSQTVEEIRRYYTFDESCQGTVPEAIVAFLDSTDFTSAIRNAISLGGDADTVGCITGAIAEAYYKQIPEAMLDKARGILPEDFLSVISEFEGKFGGANFIL